MTIRVEWTAPTTHTSGRPVGAGDLTGYILSMRVQGAPSFSEIGRPTAADVQFDVDVTDPGTYEFQLEALASNGTTSAPGTASVTIADTSPLAAPVVTARIV